MVSVNWGILGVAKINDRLIPAFHKSCNAAVSVIASRDAAKAAAAAKAAGIPHSCGRYEDVLADPSIQAVYLPLPNALHVEWAKKAADAGKHILCEKPLAPTAAEAADLIAYCQAKGVKLLDGFMWPHHPRTARIRELIQAGEIGDVLSAAGAFTFLLNLTTENIRLHADMGGGSLLDVGCYPVYGIRWAFGAEPVRVFATAKMLHGVDVAMKGLLWFADGRSASFDCGFTEPLRQWFEIVGTGGVITIRNMWLPTSNAELDIQRGEIAVETIACPGFDQIVCMIESFSRAILENRDPWPAADEAVRTLRVLDALARSAREERVVEIGN